MKGNELSLASKGSFKGNSNVSYVKARSLKGGEYTPDVHRSDQRI